MNKIGGGKNKRREPLLIPSLGLMILLLCFMAHGNAWVDKVLKDKASKLRIISARSCLKKEVKKFPECF